MSKTYRVKTPYVTMIQKSHIDFIVQTRLPIDEADNTLSPGLAVPEYSVPNNRSVSKSEAHDPVSIGCFAVAIIFPFDCRIFGNCCLDICF